MNLRHKFKVPMSLDKLFDNYFSNNAIPSGDELYFLVDLIHLFRPKHPKKVAVVSISKLLLFLEQNPNQKQLFQDYIYNLLQNRKFSNFLSDAGILQNPEFIYEVKKANYCQIFTVSTTK